MKKTILIGAFMLPLGVWPQTSVTLNKQQHFPKDIPAGNYSGITPIGNDRYAVVSDKSATDGFFIFHIAIDSLTGRINSIRNEGFRSTGSRNRDQEGIAYLPERNTLFISGEADNRILEYTLTDSTTTYTSRRLDVPAIFASADTRYGFESLTYNACTHRFWTTTESTLPQDGPQATPANKAVNRLRLQSFDDRLKPAEQYFYEMDPPEATKQPGQYAMGVSELCARDDGSIIVLEREFYVAKSKLGSFVRCKLYLVCPQDARQGTLLAKRLLASFRTCLTLFDHGIANYEGMCLGPRLKDGRQVLILVSDSQNQYKGILKDWFKTLLLKNE